MMFYHALLCSGCCRVSTLEDDTDSDLTTVGITNTQIVVDNKVSPPNECPPSYETPTVLQQTAGFYTDKTKLEFTPIAFPVDVGAHPSSIP